MHIRGCTTSGTSCGTWARRGRCTSGWGSGCRRPPSPRSRRPGEGRRGRSAPGTRTSRSGATSWSSSRSSTAGEIGRRPHSCPWRCRRRPSPGSPRASPRHRRGSPRPSRVSRACTSWCSRRPTSARPPRHLAAEGVAHDGVIRVRRRGRRMPLGFVEIDSAGRSPEGRLAVAEALPARRTGADHPNGAFELVGPLLCVADDELADVERRYTRYLGRDAARRGDGPASSTSTAARSCSCPPPPSTTYCPANGRRPSRRSWRRSWRYTTWR